MLVSNIPNDLQVRGRYAEPKVCHILGGWSRCSLILLRNQPLHPLPTPPEPNALRDNKYTALALAAGCFP